MRLPARKCRAYGAAGVLEHHEVLPTGILGMLRAGAFAAVIVGAAFLAHGGSAADEIPLRSDSTIEPVV